MTTNTLTMKSTTMDKSWNIGRWITWGLFALALVLAPLVFSSGASVSILSQIGTVMIFALSYNMLLGQGGMLSFGHAVYSGLGAFFAIHAMNLAAAGSMALPVSLIPLVGGVAGMFFGMLFGYVTTKKSGTTFAMITLGLVELTFACSLMFPEFFGGEGGISTNRVYGGSFMGITFGPQIEVYYLIAAWLFISTVGMYAFAHTPLGRIINAVRDNPERVEFIGYDTQWARYLTLILSGFFAGISGGLGAINFEIVTAENVSAARSGAVLLFTFIGGVGYFFGPMIGAIIGVFLTVMLSDFTKAWQLYLGIFFILIVMYAPGGIASIIVMNARVARFGKYRRLLPRLAAVSAASLLGFAGTVMAIEMLYHLTLESADGTVMKLFGVTLDTAAATPWIAVAALLAVAGILFRKTRHAFARVWDDVNAEIEEQIRKGAA
jgi:branched-chain amino acid transport system permease protein